MKAQKFFIIASLLFSPFIVKAQVTANFTFANDSNPCQVGLIHFTDQSTGNIVSWAWDFNDGSQSNIQNPVHAYPFSFTYQVRLIVTDNLGASDTVTQLVTVSPGITVSINKTNATCTCNGMAGAVVTNGTPPYSYSWSAGTPVLGDSVINLCTGNVTVTVTDSNSCSATASTSIASSVLNVNISKTDASCNGSCDGGAMASVSGGTQPYTYSWTNGMNGAGGTGICAGTYTVTITDNNNCTTTASVTINQPPAITLFGNVTNGGCTTAGQICLGSSGGNPPFTYTWSNSFTGSCMTNAASGAYSITLTDANGCTAANSFTVTGSLLSTLNHASCGCNGSISLGNPVGPTTIAWSTGDTTASIQNLCTGDYSVTITDTSGTCSDTFTIVQLPPMTVSVNSSSGSCITQSGFACATVTGGTPGYTYLWSNGSTAQCVQNLPAGTYSLTVTDSQGCSETTSINVAVNFFTVADTLSDPTCGNTDGFISISASGGSGNFSYQWSPVSSTDSFLTGLSAGNYFATVTDSVSGCSVTKSYTLYGSCGTVSGHVFNDTNKNGAEDAGESGMPGIWVELNPGGFKALTNQNGGYTIGVAVFDTFSLQLNVPSRYVCSGTALVQDSVTFPAGSVHTVIVTQALPDAAGVDFGLAQPQQPCGIISGYVFDDVNQNGIDDGEPRKNGIVVRLSNGQSAVTDFFGMYSIEVPFNLPLTISIVPTPGSYFCGANQPVFNQTFPPFNGTYTVTLTPGSPNSSGNDFGVHATPFFDVMIVALSPGAGNQAGRNFSIWMDYKSQGVSNLTCYLRVSFDPLVHFVSASYTPTTVTSTYIEWEYTFGTAPNWNCMQMNFYLDSSAVAGTTLTWTGSYGCGTPDGCPGNDMVTRTVQVISGPLRQSQDIGLNSMEVLHTGISPDEITTEDSVFSYYIYFQNITADTAYHLTIVDTLSPHLNIETISTPFSSKAYRLHIPAPNILIWEFDNILLPDSFTDYLNSYGFLQYNIHMKPNLPAGTRIEQRAAISFNYDQPILTNLTSVTIVGELSVATAVTDVTCSGGNDGAIDLTVTGGTDPYTYSWSNDDDTEDLVNVPAGTYTVTIEDANQIISTATATIADGFVVTAGVISGEDTAQIGEIFTYSVNPVAGYSYSWNVTNGTILSGQSTNSIQLAWDSAGLGMIQLVAEQQGCFDTASLSVKLANATSVFGGIVADIIKVRAFPNPFSEMTTIVVTGLNEKFDFILYDITGRLKNKIASSNSNQFELKREGLVSGIYFFKIFSNGKYISNGKLVIQ